MDKKLSTVLGRQAIPAIKPQATHHSKNGQIMSCKAVFTFMGLIMVASPVTAQQRERSFAQDTSFLVNAGTKLNDMFPVKHLFHYPEFLAGKVFFRDGKVSEARMNYNRLTDEMLFIGKTGDTLALDNEPTIKLICINDDTFYFDKGYVMLVRSNDVVKLGMKRGFKQGDKRKETGYDMMSSASSVSSLSSLYDDKRIYSLEVKEQALVFSVTAYYFSDKYNHFVPATEKNLADLFPEYTRLLNEFCKKNRIDFDRIRDLQTVMSFLSGTCLQKKDGAF